VRRNKKKKIVVDCLYVRIIRMCVYAISILPNTHAHAETTTTESDWRMKAPGGPQITIAFMSSPPRSRAGDRPLDLCAYMLLLRQWLPVAPTSGPNGFSLFYTNTQAHAGSATALVHENKRPIIIYIITRTILYIYIYVYTIYIGSFIYTYIYYTSNKWRWPAIIDRTRRRGKGKYANFSL